MRRVKKCVPQGSPHAHGKGGFPFLYKELKEMWKVGLGVRMLPRSPQRDPVPYLAGTQVVGHRAEARELWENPGLTSPLLPCAMWGGGRWRGAQAGLHLLCIWNSVWRPPPGMACTGMATEGKGQGGRQPDRTRRLWPGGCCGR